MKTKILVLVILALLAGMIAGAAGGVITAKLFVTNNISTEKNAEESKSIKLQICLQM